MRNFVRKIGLIGMGRWKEGSDLERYLLECDNTGEMTEKGKNT